jgi:membrane-associated tyrosine- and threonine-specific cdc2-inhibitory kinase
LYVTFHLLYSFLLSLTQKFFPSSLDLTPENSTVDYFESEFTSIELLASGKFGEVFKAVNRHDQKPYAIKRTKHPFRSLKQRERAIQEVRFVASLKRHPHCVAYLQAWEQRGHFYIQMELCNGGSLQGYLDKLPEAELVPEDDVWRSLMQMTLGLKQIHDHQLLHLDLKPSNVFIADSLLKLGDYGRMIRMGADFEPGMEGDCKYIPLEVLQNTPELPPVGPAADVFALGMMLFELTTNIEPPSVGENWLRMRSGQIHTYIPETHGRSADLIEMISALCQQDPRKRPTCDQILSHKRIWPLLQAHSHLHPLPPPSPAAGNVTLVAPPPPTVSETPPKEMLLADAIVNASGVDESEGEFFDRTLVEDEVGPPNTPAPAAAGAAVVGRIPPAGHVRPKNLLFEFDRLG